MAIVVSGTVMVRAGRAELIMAGGEAHMPSVAYDVPIRGIYLYLGVS